MNELEVIDRAWQQYQECVRRAGATLRSPGYPTDPRLRAEGYRYLGRITQLAQQIYVEFGSSTHPMLFRYGDDVTAFGASNTDNNYYRAPVNCDGHYRVYGNTHNAREILFSVQDGEFVFGKTQVLAECALSELIVDADGTFELLLGGEPRPHNWLPLPAGTEYLNVREFVADWEHDGLAVLNIEHVNVDTPPAPLTALGLATALGKAGAWVERSIATWHQYALAIRSTAPTNHMPPPTRPAGSANHMLHGGCQWSLAADEALLIEFELPTASYWSMQNYVIDWMQPLDFVNRVTSLNNRQVHVDCDHRVRLVVAHEDPGVQNWLDTSELPNGLTSYRYVNPRHAPTPQAKVVKLGQLPSHLPSDTPRFTAAERHAQVTRRRAGIARRFRR